MAGAARWKEIEEKNRETNNSRKRKIQKKEKKFPSITSIDHAIKKESSIRIVFSFHCDESNRRKPKISSRNKRKFIIDLFYLKKKKETKETDAPTTGGRRWFLPPFSFASRFLFSLLSSLSFSLSLPLFLIFRYFSFICFFCLLIFLRGGGSSSSTATLLAELVDR